MSLATKHLYRYVDPMVSLQEPHEQILLRFQDRTTVLSVPRHLSYHRSCLDDNSNNDRDALSHWLLQECSHRTGWSLQHLRIQHISLPFVTLQVIPRILGGKGGFGTLLKGQSRQAGAKLTTDFGACRDLQGRRLRHVNDEIKLRKFRERERRKQNGETVEDEDLWKTASGIYNWHLMTPTWADISKKATSRIKRQFQKMDQQEQKEALKRKEQEDLHKNTMNYYLEQTESTSQSVQSSLGDALKQGLVVAANANKRKRQRQEETFSWEERPNSLCTLTGGVVISASDGDGSASVQLQSQSEFATAVYVLDKIPTSSQTVYYEVTLVTGGLAQIGWASLVGEVVFAPNNEVGDGVGDDAASFAIDGSRGLKFHAGQESEYKMTEESWKAGDRIGCLWDVRSGDVSYTINGTDLGVAFTSKLQSLVPAFSCNQGQVLELHIREEDCTYFPKSGKGIAVGDLILDEPQKSKDEITSKLGPAAEQIKDRSKGGVNATMDDILAEAPVSLPSPVPIPPKQIVEPELLELDQFGSVSELEALGLERLKSALMAVQVKCGGSLAERAERLFSLKGLARKDYPQKVRAKGFVA